MYYIYHIPGEKIGCTKNYPARPASQSDNYELLEIHEDIENASNRELELQAEYGYKVDDNDYKSSTNNGLGYGGGIGRIFTKEECSRAGKIAAASRPTKVMRKMQSAGGKKSTSILRTCPHCNDTIKGPFYFRAHGNRCKHKKIDI